MLKTTSKNPRIKLIHSGNRMAQTLFAGEASTEGDWFRSNRQAILAPFAVGTVDQALMSVVNARFAAVRAMGLLGKVLIVDEVHAYDAYTSGLIVELIRRITSLGGIVVLLSATLTNRHKAELLGERSDFLKGDSAVRLTIKTKEGIETVSEGLGEVKPHPVTVHLSDDVNKVLKQVRTRVQNGEQILWVENTVAEAQQIYQLLKNEGWECGLLHSRFRAGDREQNERYWVTLFGKNGREKRRENGRILIGTQVLEQSLDLDADCLVTRVAPLDLLVQRFGRLWRHENTTRPSSCQHADAFVLLQPESGSQKSEGPLTRLFGKTGRIYSKHILASTKKVLEDRLKVGKTLQLPTEVSALLEAVYRSPENFDSDEERSFWLEDARRRESLNAMVFGRLATDLPTESDDRCEDAVTRVIDRSSFDLLVLDADWEQHCPSSLSDRLLWLEKNLVKTTRVLSTATLVYPESLKDTLTRSKRFKGVAVCVVGPNHELQTWEGLSPVQKGKLFYSKQKGLADEYTNL